MRWWNDSFQVKPKGYSCALDLLHWYSLKVYFKHKLTNVLSCFLFLSLHWAAIHGSQLLTDKQWKVIGARPVEITAQNCFSQDLQIITGSCAYQFQPVAIYQKVFIKILSQWKQNIVVLEEKPWNSYGGNIRTKMDIEIIWFAIDFAPNHQPRP